MKGSVTMKKNIKKIGICGTRTICRISPLLLSKILYRIKFKKKMDYKNPQGFNEKLQWLKFNFDEKLVIKCADKDTLHEYVKEKQCTQVLNEVYGVYRNVEEIDYDKLPDKFALKGTHGCGFNIICTDKSKLNIEATNKLLDKWLKTKYGYTWAEIHYNKMEPKIIAEKFIEGLEEGEALTDYKIHCFNGVPKFTLVCKERVNGIGKAKYYYFDNDWNVLSYTKKSEGCTDRIEKPASFEKMMEYSKILSEGIPFVRVDFYNTADGPILGEMTFTPNAGLDEELTSEAEIELGNMIDLSNVKSNKC
ncbi:MAG: ATP-grasp fold amidoligase family protein [Sarcina sp.]